MTKVMNHVKRQFHVKTYQETIACVFL